MLWILILGFILGFAFNAVTEAHGRRAARVVHEEEALALADPDYYTWQELSA